MIHTVTSPMGGVFNVIVDDFHTRCTIDTFVAPGDSLQPTCYPIAFPPFQVTPPGYSSRDNHTMSLIYIGASPDAPQGIESSAQLDSYAIPIEPDPRGINNRATSGGSVNIYTLLAIVLWTWILWYSDLRSLP